MRTCFLSIVVFLNLLMYYPQPGGAQSAQQAAAPNEISADLGTCSALITVTGADGKPVYAAKINTRIQYGLLGAKKLDLEAFTGADGQVKLAKLPEVVKKPMYIHISKDDKGEVVEFKPAVSCRATFNVQLQ